MMPRGLLAAPSQSLPSRERELKQQDRLAGAAFNRSLPSRERELKHYAYCRPTHQQKSLPSRERELKHIRPVFIVCAIIVAPLAGARIETMLIKPKGKDTYVAPLAGARIETIVCFHQ